MVMAADEEVAPVPTLEIVIRFDQVTGQIEVRGQLDNRVIALGMLEVAKSILSSHVPPQVQVARPERSDGLLLPRRPSAVPR